jgi:opacity protein-like surface antigen
MKKSIASAALAATCLAPAVALAQGTGLTMPYERNFWGHVGLSLGKSELDATCTGGLRCDKTDTAWRVYGGGRFNNIFGGEIGYTDFGDFTRNGGETDAQSFDFTLLAGIPFGSNRNWAVFGKLGAAYTRSDVTSVLPGRTGDEDGWGARYGIGLQAGITQNWAVRADWDRTRVELRDGDGDIDTFTLGAQYTFR